MNRPFWIAIAILGGGLALLLFNDSSGEVFGMASDDFGRFVYLSALVLVIGAGIVTRRVPMGDTLRQAALWLLVVLVLVAGYQYRYELQDVASRVTAGFVPGSPLSVTDADGRVAVTLDKLPNGHFGTRMQVNGATIDAMVDTGATTTVLTARDAAEAGFSPQSLSYTVPIYTANGQAMAARITADTVSVGAIERKRLPMLVAEDGRLGQSLLGMNFISSLSGFDVRGDRMILRD